MKREEYKDVSFGENTVIEKNVKIGKGSVIGHNVVIREDTEIGENVIVSDGVILGKKPYRASNSAVTNENELNPLIIRNNVKIGANSVIYRGCILNEKVFVGDIASIREDVEVGERTIIGRGVSIENKTRIGKRVKIETNAYITAYSTIEDYCFIAPEVSFSNDNFLGRTEERKKHFKGPTLRRGARIGANSTLLPGVEIGEDALVGAGSVVTKNLEGKKVYIGSPAKYIKDVPEEQLLENQNWE